MDRTARDISVFQNVSQAVFLSCLANRAGAGPNPIEEGLSILKDVEFNGKTFRDFASDMEAC